jgi:hypothetical protein
LFGGAKREMEIHEEEDECEWGEERGLGAQN